MRKSGFSFRRTVVFADGDSLNANGELFHLGPDELLLHTQQLIDCGTFVPIVLLQRRLGTFSIKAHFANSRDGVFFVFWFGVAFRPEFGRPIEFLPIFHVHFGHLGVLRITGFRTAHECLQRQQCRFDGQGRTPLVF